MILTDSMLDAAFNFRMTEPWKELTDSDIFAVGISDGTIVYCSIMGHGGEHYSLGIYVGEEGFSTYLRTLMNSGADIVTSMQESIAFDCINCDFMQAKDIDNEVKTVVRCYAHKYGIKIPRKHGWIDFTRFMPYRGQWCITNPKDAMIAEEALRAATFFVLNFQDKSYADVGLDSMGEYPPVEGGKQIPFVTNENGIYHINSIKTPPLQKSNPIVPLFTNDILIYKVKALPHTSTMECRLFHVPMPVHSKKCEQPVYPGIFIMIDQMDGKMQNPVVTTDYPQNPNIVLTDIAQQLCSLNKCPKEIIVNDDVTFALISDFCKKCGIKLTMSDDVLPDMEEACFMMLQEMMMGEML